MPFDRIITSYNRAEWWYGHLAKALARHAKIVHCPMVRPNQPGHPAETNVENLIATANGERRFYFGSFDQMFRGIEQLDVSTAVWVDFSMPQSLHFLPCFRIFDVSFCTGRDSLPLIRKSGAGRVEWLPFAFDDSLENKPESERIYDVGFVGSLELPATREERLSVLGMLERRYRMNDFRTPVFGDAMMRAYNRSRIVVNIPIPGGFNMRTFEAMASGALLLTKRVGNGQGELFREGIHFVTYANTRDLTDKLDYFLKNESERADIAAAGMREVLARHTYLHRAARVIEVMETADRTRSTTRRDVAAAYAAFYNYIDRADLLGAVAFEHGVPTALRGHAIAKAGWKFLRQGLEGRRRSERR